MFSGKERDTRCSSILFVVRVFFGEGTWAYANGVFLAKIRVKCFYDVQSRFASMPMRLSKS